MYNETCFRKHIKTSNISILGIGSTTNLWDAFNFIYRNEKTWNSVHSASDLNYYNTYRLIDEQVGVWMHNIMIKSIGIQSESTA